VVAGDLIFLKSLHLRSGPECGTLCCRQRGMEALLHAGRNSSSFGGSVAEHSPLRAASGRAGATIGASKASRTPECGTLCCRQRGMEALLHAVRSSSSFRRFSLLAFAAPRRIRQSRSYHWREQSVAHSVRCSRGFLRLISCPSPAGSVCCERIPRGRGQPMGAPRSWEEGAVLAPRPFLVSGS
jgi:hypothetical protein